MSAEKQAMFAGEPAIVGESLSASQLEAHAEWMGEGMCAECEWWDGFESPCFRRPCPEGPVIVFHIGKCHAIPPGSRVVRGETVSIWLDTHWYDWCGSFGTRDPKSLIGNVGIIPKEECTTAGPRPK